MQSNRQIVVARAEQHPPLLRRGEGFYSPAGREAKGVLQLDNTVVASNKAGRF
jgi:hypothetical protein